MVQWNDRKTSPSVCVKLINAIEDEEMIVIKFIDRFFLEKNKNHHVYIFFDKGIKCKFEVCRV